MFVTADLAPTMRTGNILLDSLLYETGFVPGIRITYVLQGAPGEGAFGGLTWSTNGARTAFAQAAATWSAVANVFFEEAAGPYNGTGQTSAYDWIETFERLEPDLYARHELPYDGTLYGTYNSFPGLFTAESLKPAGDGFSTFVHEIGHGLGLLHPHNDEEDAANDPRFPGVFESSDLGFYTLNQGVFTVMTYNDGYEQVGLSLSAGIGWAKGPMALDIAAVQRIYGANMTTGTGNDSYLLPQVNDVGTGWAAIWDVAGADTISAVGALFDAIIDLRAATLLEAPGGGGYVSRVTGILGGLTIANGVLIENAIGGAADDRLHGNAAANRLDGGAGFDTVDYSGVSAALVIDLAAGTASGDGADTLVSIEGAVGGSGNDRLVAGAPASVAAGDIDLVKRATDAISSRQAALALDGHFAVRTGDARIPGTPGLVSVTVRAESGAALDYYSFTAPASGRVFIDIDNSFAVDTLVRLLDADGGLVIVNDDGNFTDPGSANERDSYLTVDTLVAGRTYVIEVSRYGGLALEPGSSYDLRVAMAAGQLATGTQLRGATLDGGAGNDVLVGSAGNDWLIGGSGDDTLDGRGGDDRIDGGEGVDIAVFAGLIGTYQVNLGDNGALLIGGGGEGSDRLTGIEGFRFADGLFRWDAATGKLVAQGTQPRVDAAQAITVAEDGTTAFIVGASDPEGDALTWQVSAHPLHGTVSGGTNGAFTYTPFVNYNGPDQFVIAVRDPGTATSLQTVSVTVAPINDVPALSVAAQSLSTAISTPLDFQVSASDVDGDMLSYIAGVPAHGTLTARGNGGFTYAPTGGYVGSDAFTITVSDGRGGVATQQIDFAVRPPLAANPGFKAYLADGFVGGLGGSGQIIGTNRAQDMTMIDRPGAITFDASFSRGVDVVRLPGAAGTYRITQMGSVAVLVDGDSSYSFPAGPAGLVLMFADGARTVAFDAAGVMRIGGQQVTATAQTIVAGAQPAGSPVTGDAAAAARVFLDPGGQVEMLGTVQVTGTAQAEQVTWRGGDLTLDGSFNRGGDVLHLGQSAQAFFAYRTGSSVVLVNGDSEIAVPLGEAGLSIDFAGEVRIARIDTQSLDFFIGSQVIDAARTTPEPLVPIASLALAFTAPGGSAMISSDGNYIF